MSAGKTSGSRLFGMKGPNPLKEMNAAKAAAAPVTAHRRSLLGKVHLAAKEMGLADDDYRAILINETGKRSAKDCTDAELIQLLEAFKRKGWKSALANGQRGAARPADHPGAGKARAMWISLYHLGAIANPSDEALEAFARRQLGCERLQWADQALIYRLIEALKAIATRNHWPQSIEGVKPSAVAIVLKHRLVEAILVKLQDATIAPADWGVARAAYAFGGIEITSVMSASMSQLDLIAQAFGAKLREAAR